MSDNPDVRAGTAGGTITVAGDEVTIYGGAAVLQGIKVHDGAEGGTVGAAVTSAGELVVHQQNSGTVAVSSAPTTTVQATDLDVRDLDSATDSVAAVQSGAWNVGGTVEVAGTALVSGTVEVTGGGGDGAILDGASASVKASVFDYTNSNPLAVRLTDETGDYVAPAGSGTVAVSGGTVNVGGTALVHVTNSGTVSVSNTVTVDGSGVTQPVSHAALTELAGAIDGTEVQVDVVGALPAGSNNIGDVDVASSVLPTGAATEAKQDTVIGHVDGIEGLLTTIDSDTGTVAGAVAGSEMQVDVVTMPTATVQATNLDIRDLTSASDSVAAAQSGEWNVGGTVTKGSAVVGLGHTLGGTAINLTASGIVVPAVASKVLYITHEAFTVQGGTVTITARNGSGGGTLWGPMQFSPTGGMAVSAPIDSGGLYQTAAGSAVYYELAGAGTVGGRIRWAQP